MASNLPHLPRGAHTPSPPLEGPPRPPPGACLQDELLMFGLLSLLLPYLQIGLSRICLPAAARRRLRRLLGASDAYVYACPPGTWQPYSSAVVHDAHVLLFMIALAHVMYACLTMVLCLFRVGGARLPGSCCGCVQPRRRRARPHNPPACTATPHRPAAWAAIAQQHVVGPQTSLCAAAAGSYTPRYRQTGGVRSARTHQARSYQLPPPPPGALQVRRWRRWERTAKERMVKRMAGK